MLLGFVWPRLFPLAGTAVCLTVDIVGPCFVDVMTGDGACFMVDMVGAMFDEVGSKLLMNYWCCWSIVGQLLELQNFQCIFVELLMV